MMISDAELRRMKKLNGEMLIDRINAIEEEEDPELYCMDKLWDGLHFLLTGVSASEPIEENPLSKAIVGVYVFEVDPDDGFVASIQKEELVKILAAMEAVDLPALCSRAKLSAFRRNKIYPSIWVDNARESLLAELSQEFEALLAFYKAALEKQMPILISIF